MWTQNLQRQKSIHWKDDLRPKDEMGKAKSDERKGLKGSSIPVELRATVNVMGMRSPEGTGTEPCSSDLELRHNPWTKQSQIPELCGSPVPRVRAVSRGRSLHCPLFFSNTEAILTSCWFEMIYMMIRVAPLAGHSLKRESGWYVTGKKDT